MLSRRDMVGRLAASAAAVLTASAARASLTATRDESDALSGSGQADRTAPAPAVVSSAPDVVGSVGPCVDSALPTTESAPAPWELLRPLAQGSAVAHGWHVAGLTGLAGGSCVLTLQNERGRQHRIHLCRNGGRPQGLVYTRRLDLVVMNGGQGDLPTEEGLAQAVAEVAHVLAANESDRQYETLVTALLPQIEREQLFASGAGLR